MSFRGNLAFLCGRGGLEGLGQVLLEQFRTGMVAVRIHSTQDQLVGDVEPWERKLGGSLADSYVL